MAISRRVQAARRNGRLGGLATANNHSPEFLEARASKAGTTNCERYGVGYYSHIARGPRKKTSTRQRIKEVTETISTVVTPESSPLQLMQEAAKAI